MIHRAQKLKLAVAVSIFSSVLCSCSEHADLEVREGTGPDPALPEPESTLIPTVNIAEATGWPTGEKPESAHGLTVTAFADGLDHPRWLYTLPNGDVLVAETNAPTRPEDDNGIKGWVMSQLKSDAGAGVPSADRITLLRDTDNDGVADYRSVFIDGLYSPFGMALVEDKFYVANTDAVLEFQYHDGNTSIQGKGKKLVDLPGGELNHHWTKSLIASPDGSKLYVGVGSNSNVAENGMDKEAGRAAIWEIDRRTGEASIYAEGLRNPVGMAWVPGSPSSSEIALASSDPGEHQETGASRQDMTDQQKQKELWVAVNERDALGGDLVPDYMTSVKEDGFYGWPYSYYGQHVDKRVEPARPDLVAKAIKPDYALGPHTASLGLLYPDNNNLPSAYQNGMFVGQHGSWNREPRSGYRVIFIKFEGGVPTGLPNEVLTGFIHNDQAYGRPVGLALTQNGNLLVADDVGNTIWHVSAATSSEVSRELSDSR